MEHEFRAAPESDVVTDAPGRLQAAQAHMVALCAQHLHLMRREIYVLSLVARETRTPWHAKLIAALALAYAFSPIQLIPSFLPVVGWLDDVVILGLGVRLALRLTPPDVLASCREHAAESEQSGDEAGVAGRRALLVVGAVWLTMATLGMGLSVALIRRFL
jgi:uncharacterized membrane protein YkvA (DUF1232 family)